MRKESGKGNGKNEEEERTQGGGIEDLRRTDEKRRAEEKR